MSGQRTGFLLACLDLLLAALAVLLFDAVMCGPIRIVAFGPMTLGWPVLALAAAGVAAGRHAIRPAPWAGRALLEMTTRIRHDRAARVTVSAVLMTRLAVFLLGLVATITLGHAARTNATPIDSLAVLPDHWDASWYLGIASGGYRWVGAGHSNSRLAFFPAFPMAFRAVAAVLHLPDQEAPWLWAGVVLSTAFFLGALIYLYKLANAIAGERAARAAVWMAACYPFSYFYGQVYSESLYLLAAVGVAYCSYTERGLMAAFWGLVAGLTRPIGVLVGLLVMMTPGARWRGPWSLRRQWIAVALAPGLGTFIYSAYVKWLTGGWLTWLSDQESWGRTVQDPLALALGVLRTVRAEGLVGYISTNPYDAINAAAVLLAVSLGVLVARRIGIGAALFVFLSVLIPLRVGGLASAGRYSAVAFPVFIALGSLSASLPLAAICAVLEGLMTVLFYTDRPVF